MKSRRSESCPRLPRKGPTAPALEPSDSQPVRGCTLQDLGPEDKQKVAKLLKQVVDLGQEVHQLRLHREEDEQTYAAREQELQESNRQLHMENESLKKKLGKVLLVLRASQAKVNAMEAAQQAALEARRSAEVQTEGTTAAQQPEPPQPPAQQAQEAPAANMNTAPHDCALTLAPPPAAAPAPAATGPEDTAVSLAGIRAPLQSSQGVPQILHVPHGAHINITINHNPEPSASLPAAQARAPVPIVTARYPDWRGSTAGDDASSAGSYHTGIGGAPHVSDAASNTRAPTGARAPPASSIIAIPTTAAAAAAATASTAAAPVPALTACSSITLDAAQPELLAACSSPRAVDSPAVEQPGPGTSAWWAARSGQRSPKAGAGSVPKEGLEPAAAAIAVRSSVGPTIYRPAAPRSITVDATMREYDTVPVHEVYDNGQEAPITSPMIVPPSDEVVAAASSLLGWQAQHGFVGRSTEAAGGPPPPSSAAFGSRVDDPRALRAGRKVLSFDPAIGKNGAFYFIDVADTVTHPPAAATGSGPTLAPPSDPRGSARQQPYGVLPAAGALEGPAAQHGPGPCAAERPGPHATAFCRPQAAAGVAAASAGSGASVSLSALQGSRMGGAAHGSLPGEEGGARPQAGQQHHLQAHLQPQLQPHPLAGRPPPQSPCSSTTTDSSVAQLPSRHAHVMAATLASYPTGTPNSTLSQMASMLDEVARQQRWDARPPLDVLGSQPCGPLPASAAAWAPERDIGRARSATPSARHPAGLVPGAGAHPSAQHSQEAGRVRSGLQHGGLQHGAGPGLSGRTPASSRGSASVCSDQAYWAGGSNAVNRYDDSLTDIVSEADQEMEQQIGVSHGRPNPQRQGAQPMRGPTPPGPGSTGSEARHRGATVAMGASAEGRWRMKQKATASMEALLAANLYEENDVFSVILEQESQG